MPEPFYRFILGSFRCIAVSDGSLNYPIESFFKGKSTAEIQARLARHNLPITHIYSPYTCLFIDTGTHKVMVDVGAGNIAAEAQKLFPHVDNSQSVTGTLAANLQAAGIHPDEVDTIIITHAHGDHIGGMLDNSGELVFANANYTIARAEWEFWSSDERTAGQPLSFVSMVRSNVTPLMDRLTQIELEADILPGISVLPTPGHTPGHFSLAIESDRQELLHFSDAAIHPLHMLYPESNIAFDVEPEKTIESKRRILDRAAQSGALVFGHHFPPFPNLGHVKKVGEHWEWEPLAI